MLRLPMRSAGGQLALTSACSHFPELVIEMELLGSWHNADLTEGQLDALWAHTHQASKSLALSIPLLVACDSPDDIGEE
jgi:hypothetical protein